MNVSNTDESVKSGSGRQSAGSQGSRPGTGGRGYKLQNIDESNPKGSVLEASFIRRKEQAWTLSLIHSLTV
ncbi:hypothetical protein EB796_002722 [Bugula neritina]|uniref:Uncharacterized protein n=1 Tax=Bugula neritina TaxID=10212 RepID=A0A7J7KK69_BUGNE|nr:hypothetical protein EB796_002722 [Bugula neritina]